jgi:hypothetical protein
MVTGAPSPGNPVMDKVRQKERGAKEKWGGGQSSEVINSSSDSTGSKNRVCVVGGVWGMCVYPQTILFSSAAILFDTPSSEIRVKETTARQM